jgi:hypothetical protein
MEPSPQIASARRNLAPVPWRRDGCLVLQVSVSADVPTFDDPMVRDAIARASMAAERVDTLERMLNRELWRIGYTARLHYDPDDHSTVRVEIADGR